MSSATLQHPSNPVTIMELAKTDPSKALEAALAATAEAQREAAETRLLAQMELGKDGLEATNSAQLWWLAGIYYRSGAAPKDDMFIGKERVRPEKDVRARLFLKMTFGAELGLKPLQALQNVAIINNRPCIWGDAAKALVLRSGLCEYCRDEEVGKPGTETWGFRCTTKRSGQSEETTTFTLADAKRAGLMSKPGDLYKLYPQRMLMFRARGFRLRDTYPDVLKGLITAEEARDIDVRPQSKTEMRSFEELVGISDDAQEPEPTDDSANDTLPGSSDSQSATREQSQTRDRQPGDDDEPTETTASTNDGNLFDEFTDQLPQRSEIGPVQELIRQYVAAMSSQEMKDKVTSRGEMRIAEIRGSRGQKSNGNMFDKG